MTKEEQRAVAGIVVALALIAGLAWAGSDGSVRIGSISTFAACGLVALAINGLGFLHSVAQRTERYFDLLGSITYISMTLVALATAPELDTRRVVVGAMVLAWAGRLGRFLFDRIRRDGHDRRFEKLLKSPIRLAATWALQALWAFLTASCALVVITAEGSRSFGVLAALGFGLWVVGLGFEVVADTQKSVFKQDPANEGRFISTGLWSWSRHPNYFGEIVLWIGVAVFALPDLTGWRIVATASPVFVFVLLNYVSGVPLLERRGQAAWGDEPEYQEYLARTPSLIPRPPRQISTVRS